MRLLFERLLLLLALSCPHGAWAQAQTNPVEGFDPKRDYLSNKYVAGTGLIYDCEDKHWVCVEQSIFETCKADNAKDIEAGRTELSCVATQLYGTKKECFARHREVIVRGDVPRTCLLPKERRRFIGFR